MILFHHIEVLIENILFLFLLFHNINNYNKLVGLKLKHFNIKERTTSKENLYHLNPNKRYINRSMINEKMKNRKKLNIKLIKNNIFNYYLNNNINELGNKNNIKQFYFSKKLFS